MNPDFKGGLAIRDFRVCNQAANLRHIWNLLTNSENLWTQWVRKLLIKDNHFWSLNVPQNALWCWRNLLKDRVIAGNFVKHVIGNGNGTFFWRDP